MMLMTKTTHYRFVDNKLLLSPRICIPQYDYHYVFSKYGRDNMLMLAEQHGEGLKDSSLLQWGFDQTT